MCLWRPSQYQHWPTHINFQSIYSQCLYVCICSNFKKNCLLYKHALRHNWKCRGGELHGELCSSLFILMSSQLISEGLVVSKFHAWKLRIVNSYCSCFSVDANLINGVVTFKSHVNANLISKGLHSVALNWTPSQTLLHMVKKAPKAQNDHYFLMDCNNKEVMVVLSF